VSLYFGQRSPFPMQTARVAAEADEAGASWLAVDGAHWGVAPILPVRYIRPMLSWKPGARFRMYDQRHSAWLATNRVTPFYPWPSLVAHRDAPSLLPGHGLRPGRVAHRFIGEDASALDLDGAGPVKHVGLLRRVRPVRPSHREEPMSATS